MAPTAPGATATVRFTVTDEPNGYPSLGAVPLQEMGENLVQIRIGDQKLATQPPLGKVIVK